MQIAIAIVIRLLKSHKVNLELTFIVFSDEETTEKHGMQMALWIILGFLLS